MNIDLPTYRSYPPRQLRSFGLLFAGVLAGLGALSAWRGGWALEPAIWLWAGGAVAFAGAGVAWPAVLRPLLHAWMVFGAVAGSIVSRVVLTLAYLLVITPVGLVLRLRGWDLLDLRLRDRDSYWVRRGALPAGHFQRQFSPASIACAAQKPGLARRWAGSATALGLGAVLILGVGEVALRLFHRVARGVPMLAQDERVPFVDATLGWAARPGWSFRREKLRADGTSYQVDFRADARGFRAFGDPSAKRPKVLFLGDSFTQAVEVSTGASWAEVAARKLDIEPFVYGVGGYGNLQELMVLERYLDEIRPELVVLQFSSNDFLNNSFELESASVQGNNRLRRPYWENGRVVYATPARLPWVRDFAREHLRFVTTLFNQADRYQAALLPSVEEEIRQQAFSHPGFQRAFATTVEILKQFRERAGVPVFVFDVGDEPGFPELCRAAELICSQAPDRAVRQLHQLGTCTLVSDSAHWTEEGHRAAGESVAHEIEARGLIVRR